jgi:hypothetical protein
MFKGNRFMNLTEQEFWSNPAVSLPVPVGVKMSVVDPNSIVLEKKGYFRIRYSLEAQASGNGVPPWLDEYVSDQDVETIPFIVKMEADFDRFTAESPSTTEAKKWLESVQTSMKGRWGDPD